MSSIVADAAHGTAPDAEHDAVHDALQNARNDAGDEAGINAGHDGALAGIVTGLRAVREKWRAEQQRPRDALGRELPSPEVVREIIALLRGALFPMRLGPPDLREDHEDQYVAQTLARVLQLLQAQAQLELGHGARLLGSAVDADMLAARARAAAHAFLQSLPLVRALLDTDVEAAFHGDPAAHSVDEVLLCYPGATAIIQHRLAHRLYTLGLPLLARMINEHAHQHTGIDIHPGAKIGAHFFIDHGTGVVIGETAVLGQRVRLYQAVTLGARSFTADAQGRLHKGAPRHPIVEDDVVIYAGATVLGRITVGRGSIIGGNVWLTRSVAVGSHVTQASSQHDLGAAPGRSSSALGNAGSGASAGASSAGPGRSASGSTG